MIINLFKNQKRLILLSAFFSLLIISFISVRNNYEKVISQNLNMTNLPPVLNLYMISPSLGVYLNKDLCLTLFNNKGKLISGLTKFSENKFQDKYKLNDDLIIVDYSSINDFKNIDYHKIKLFFNNSEIKPSQHKLVWNKSFIFGTDKLGRDLFFRSLDGLNISLSIALISSGVNLLIGVIYGSVSGFLGGKIDFIMLNFLNIINSIPSILIVILLSAFIKKNFFSLVMIIGSLYWVNIARQVRAGVMSTKQLDFISAEILTASPQYKIIFCHILPNIKETIIATLILNCQNAIFLETFLSFIGLGPPPPVASLGTLINDSIDNFSSSPYQLIFMSLAVIFISFFLNNLAKNKTS